MFREAGIEGRVTIRFRGTIFEDAGDIDQEMGAVKQGFGALGDESWCWNCIGKRWWWAGSMGHIRLYGCLCLGWLAFADEKFNSP